MNYNIAVPLNISGLAPKNTTIAPYSPSGYTCTPANPNIQLLPSGVLLTKPSHVNETGTYSCTSPDINGASIVFDLTVQCKFCY